MALTASPRAELGVTLRSDVALGTDDAMLLFVSTAEAVSARVADHTKAASQDV